MRRFFGKMLSLAVAFVMMASAIPSMNAVAQSKMDFTAADYVSLPDLRKEAMSGWHQTYTAKGREVIANVDIRWMPEAQTCPIVQVEGWGKQADPKAFEPYKDKPNTRSAQRDFLIAVGLVDRDTKVFPKRTNYHGRTVTPQQLTLYGGEVPAETPENVDLDYAGFLQKVNEDIGSFSKFKLDDFRIDTVRVEGVTYLAKEKNGELVKGDPFTKMGDYYLYAKQLFHGIPVISPQAGGINSPGGYLRYFYGNPTYYHFTLAGSVELGVHTKDVPLLSFDAIKRVLEKQIEEGKLRGVDEMEFGYIAFYQGKKDNRTWLMMPVWRIKGGYTEDPKKEKVMPYHDERDRDGSLTVPMGYGDYFYSAQTGELIPTSILTEREDPLPAREIVTWESLKP